LVTILHRFYPTLSSPGQGQHERQSASGKGKITVSSDIQNAEIYVDGSFVGSVPSTIMLEVGSHKIQVKASNGSVWERDLHVLADSDVTLRATPKQN